MPPTLSKTEVLITGNHAPHLAEVTTAHQEQDAPVQAENDDAVEDNQDDYEGEEDDDYNEEGSTHGFKNLPALPQYISQPRNLQALLKLVDSPYLDLSPDYQRDVVWNHPRMCSLIDSLLQNFYIPPVIFNVDIISDENGVARWKRTCVDGKQRLTSISAFVNGKIPCHDRTGAKWYFKPMESEDGTTRAKGQILPDSVKAEFLNKTLMCTEYKGISEREEREIFQRVQRGVPLTQAEAFRATKGAWQSFAQMYEDDYAAVLNLIKSNKRAAAFQRILICFSQIYECQSPSAADGIPRFQIGIKKLEKFCAAEETLDAETKSHLRFVFDLFQEIAEEYPETFEDNGYVKVKTFAPIELVAVSVLLSQKGADRPKGLLRGDILTLRLQLRSEHIDLRMNQTVWASAWRFIDDLERHRGTVDGSTTRKASKKSSQTNKRKVKDVALPRNGATSSNATQLQGDKSDQSVSVAKVTSNGGPLAPVQQHLTPSVIESQSLPRRTHHPLGDTSSGHSPNLNTQQPDTAKVRPLDPPGSADGAIQGAPSARPRLSREALRLAAYTSKIRNEGTERTPSVASPATTDGNGHVPVGSTTMDKVRKRTNGVLGRSSGGAEALAAKKARLAAPGVKREV